MKKIKVLFLTFLLLYPFNIYAYSNKIIIGGETIGIEVHSDGVYVVGFYEVNGKNIGEKSGFLVGDIIKKIDNHEVLSINDLNSYIDTSKKYSFSVLRDNKIINIDMKLEEENDSIKTGLYVKDQINGIGTLSYIDPESRVFGSLGHEIQESFSFSKFEIEDGNIYKAEVSNIKKSVNGDTGEKNAIIDKNSNYGIINKNEIEGIFGKYTSDISNRDTYEISNPSEIKRGEGFIRTNIAKGEVNDYKINIISIDEESSTKNILFEITDKRLLNKTGGIIQGMSGSPILQNNKIIGVVNYVIVEDTKKGYGIFITTMLEEGDKIIS